MKATLATLMVSCPDRKGLVAGLAQFLSTQGANIIRAEQHRDPLSDRFIQRVLFDRGDMWVERAAFERELASVAEKFAMDWSIRYAEDIPRIAIFVSKARHCLYDLLLRQKEGELHASFPIVISNHTELEADVKTFGIPFVHIPIDNKDAAEARALELLKQHRVDTVVLARYMQILSPRFLAAFPNQVINIHHSFLPAFAGGKPYHQAMEYGVKLIGATSHYVTEQLDAGPIIEQDVVRVSHHEDIPELVAKGRDIERVVLARAVKAHVEHRVAVCGRRTIVFNG